MPVDRHPCTAVFSEVHNAVENQGKGEVLCSQKVSQRCQQQIARGLSPRMKAISRCSSSSCTLVTHIPHPNRPQRWSCQHLPHRCPRSSSLTTSYIPPSDFPTSVALHTYACRISPAPGSNQMKCHKTTCKRQNTQGCHYSCWTQLHSTQSNASVYLQLSSNAWRPTNP
jgi:hypothetical protein